LTKKRTKKEIPPYTVLAQIYDHVMSHVNYDQWADYIVQIASRHGNGGKRVLDLSCGTGTFCARLRDRGFTVYGFDSSFAMVRRARDKRGARDSPFCCADLVRPAVNIKADLVVSLYDSMNYLMAPGAWITCLRSVSAVLGSGGLFVFDVSTVYNSLNAFREMVQRDICDHAQYIRRSRYDARRKIQHNDFQIQLKDDPDSLYIEKHSQRIYTLKEIEMLLKLIPLREVSRYSDFTFQPGTETAERVHFVLKR